MENKYELYFEGGGEMGALIRSYDWASGDLGHPNTWSLNLLNTISIMLNSRFPMFLWWGPQLIQFYNDAYRPSLGNSSKHPRALGQRGADCWKETWPTIKPLIDQILIGDGSTWNEDQLIPIYRNGRLEDAYWTFSYSRVLDACGKTGGVLVICTETTKKVNAFNELLQAKSELEFAIAAAELGTWDLNPATNHFTCNERLKSWFGLPANSELPLSLATEVIAETDRQRVTDAISSAMAFESGGRYDIEYTILNPELQEPRLVKAKGQALFNEQQEVKRFSGTLQDVTGERNAMQELKDTNRKLEMALEQSRLSKTAAQLGTFDLDLVNGTMEWDERCRMLFGITHQDSVSYSHDFLTGLHPEDRDRVSKVIENLYNKSVSKGDYDIEYRTIGAADGKLRWIRAIGKVFFNTEDVAVRFIGSVLDITDRKLEELRKDDFISIVSHELKTPLTTLSAMIQLLKLKLESDTEALIPGGIDKAYRQIKKMNVLINSFLDVARFQSGKMDMNRNHFYISELVKEMVDQVVFTANGTHSIDITLCEDILVYADREKIGSVLLNILSNATKFSTQGSSIEIRCYKEGDEVKISVRDEGYGISPADQERLFEKFYRVRNKFTTNTSGFGIGLYLCRQVMDDHNGRIQVESIEGKGSTFLLVLPKATIPTISYGAN